MNFTFDPADERPLYRQLADLIADDIKSGKIPAGAKLPTVRDLAARAGISRGTVKHAYDALAQLGLVERAQGSGTFAADAKKAAGSRKDRALSLIGALFDEMRALGFSSEETRIFFDLTLREREGEEPPVRVAAVDCSPEALSVIRRQLLAIPSVDAREFSLRAVLSAARPFDPDAALTLTTQTHFEELRAKMARPDSLSRIVMAVSADTLLALARVPERARVGILTKSERFAGVIRQTVSLSCRLSNPPVFALFGDGGTDAFLADVDCLILPPNYLLFASADEKTTIDNFAARGQVLHYEYQIERGSLLHLEEEIAALTERAR